jgi:lysophospholipase L1-like esterase
MSNVIVEGDVDRRSLLGTTVTVVLASVVGCTDQVLAEPVYFALGDSITFGETDLQYVQSYGDRGYVGDYANVIASQTGTKPQVVNLAIDGETAASFLDNSNLRTPPVQGRTNAPLQLENLNYNNSTALSQSQLFAQDAAAQKAMGNIITNVTITLGFNELAALAPATNTPAAEQAAIAQIPATLTAYKANYGAVLNEVRTLAPSATVDLLGYYNPFPADPSSPAAPVFAAGGTALNDTIQSLATQYGAIYVDNATPFLGNEAAYTYQAALPAGSSVSGPYGGVLPIGNVHPNVLGYQQIADDVAAANAAAAGTAVPEPSTWAVLAVGLGTLGLMVGCRRTGLAGGGAR